MSSTSVYEYIHEYIQITRSVGAQYATGDQLRNNSRKNEEMEPKQKCHPGVGVTGDGSKSNAIKSKIA